MANCMCIFSTVYPGRFVCWAKLNLGLRSDPSEGKTKIPRKISLSPPTFNPYVPTQYRYVSTQEKVNNSIHLYFSHNQTKQHMNRLIFMKIGLKFASIFYYNTKTTLNFKKVKSQSISHHIYTKHLSITLSFHYFTNLNLIMIPYLNCYRLQQWPIQLNLILQYFRPR
jgi:hypothetical protein